MLLGRILEDLGTIAESKSGPKVDLGGSKNGISRLESIFSIDFFGVVKFKRQIRTHFIRT